MGSAPAAARHVMGLLGRPKVTVPELKDLDRVLNGLQREDVLAVCRDTTFMGALKTSGDAQWEVTSRLLSRMVVALGPGMNPVVLQSGAVEWLGQLMVTLCKTAKGHTQVRGKRHDARGARSRLLSGRVLLRGLVTDHRRARPCARDCPADGAGGGAGLSAGLPHQRRG
jgi:hypothetical protein